jgi:hypothetical protein
MLNSSQFSVQSAISGPHIRSLTYEYSRMYFDLGAAELDDILNAELLKSLALDAIMMLPRTNSDIN